MVPENNAFLTEYSKFLDSQSHLTYAALSTYRNFQNELSEKERGFLKNHIDSCPVCSEKYREVAEVEGESQNIIAMSARRFSTTFFRYSIAAVFIIAIGASIIYLLVHKPEAPSVHSIAAVAPDPERFVANPMLESSVGRTVRSGSAFSFVRPRAGDTLTAPYRFAWDGGRPGQACSLTIVDNRNSEIWKGATETGSLAYERSLTPGLYYLRLEVDGELVQVGKFFVLR